MRALRWVALVIIAFDAAYRWGALQIRKPLGNIISTALIMVARALILNRFQSDDYMCQPAANAVFNLERV